MFTSALLSSVKRFMLNFYWFCFQQLVSDQLYRASYIEIPHRQIAPTLHSRTVYLTSFCPSASNTFPWCITHWTKSSLNAVWQFLLPGSVPSTAFPCPGVQLLLLQVTRWARRKGINLAPLPLFWLWRPEGTIPLSTTLNFTAI